MNANTGLDQHQNVDQDSHKEAAHNQQEALDLFVVTKKEDRDHFHRIIDIKRTSID